MTRNAIFWMGVALAAMSGSCTTPGAGYQPDTSTYQSPRGTDTFMPDSASIAQHYTIPEWFQDAKFGIFIHWGVYSVPAFGNEWYPRNMYVEGSNEYLHHVKTYGDHTVFGYKDFIPMFTAAQFNAGEWLSLFKESGAKYIVPVAEHHDGFSMYNSTVNPWNAAKMGPMRDIVGELREATLAQGLKFGMSVHRAENAWFFNGGKNFPSDVQDPAYRSLYGECLDEPGGHNPDVPEGAGFNEHSIQSWREHTYELVDTYQPDLLWFDWTVGKYPFQPTFYSFMAYYYNNALDWGKEVVVNTKFGYGNNLQVFDIERGKSEEIRAFPWQTDTSIGKKSWEYIEGEENKTPNQIIDDLVDIVSKNGNLLLNIGPKADGTITPEQQEVLRRIGGWLKINGEAI
ncbi:MAG: alpha-L-fucosidase, partial [Cyclobacteriaceae bacterium]|nr:alpha-L-fucosidase [Cyclobacteriaceae bacterium]